MERLLAKISQIQAELAEYSILLRLTKTIDVQEDSGGHLIEKAEIIQRWRKEQAWAITRLRWALRDLFLVRAQLHTPNSPI